MNHKYPLIFSLVSGFLIFSQGCESGKSSGDGLKLRLNLNKGDAMQVETSVDQKVETEAMGQKMTINQSFLFAFETLVDDISSDGNYTLKNTYKRIRLNQNIPGIGENILDTEDPSASKGAAVALMEPIMKALIGKSFTMEMTPKGQVLRTNMSEITSQQGLEDISENNGLSDMAIEFPDNILRPGDSWEAERAVAGKLPMRIKTRYTLKEMTENLAIIDVKGEFLPADDNTKVSGTLDGTMRVDVKSGWTRESRLNQDMQMTVKQGGIELPMKITSLMVITSR